VEVVTSFRPGDVIHAEVISLGDARSYYLSTAKEELGVIMATSDAGATMVPVSWKEMQCPLTTLKEARKVSNVHRRAEAADE
jgi:exosome complex component CSL4